MCLFVLWMWKKNIYLILNGNKGSKMLWGRRVFINIFKTNDKIVWIFEQRNMNRSKKYIHSLLIFVFAVFLSCLGTSLTTTLLCIAMFIISCITHPMENLSFNICFLFWIGGIGVPIYAVFLHFRAKVGNLWCNYLIWPTDMVLW